MGVYHQMGHDSWNLIDQEALSGYRGIILSPVNTSPYAVPEKLAKLKDIRDRLEVVLDPQFYRPSSNRGQLDAWPHFSKDLDSADLSNLDWWAARCDALVNVAEQVQADSICAPAVVPTRHNDAYYELTLQVAEDLNDRAVKRNMRTLVTAIVRLAELADEAEVHRLASVFSRGSARRVYLVLHDELAPRKQRTDYKSLAGAIRLIAFLKASGVEVLVGFSGLDMLLWKAGGAAAVATGKFFNLRRFDPARFDAESEGGRVLPYWTDQHLITWLREEDLRLLIDKDVIDPASAEENPYARQIIDIIARGRGESWVALGWRQYLYWFQQTERELERDPAQVESMLLNADGLWAKIEADGILMFDRANDGLWIRPWINALREARHSLAS